MNIQVNKFKFAIFKHANTRSEGHRLTEKGSWSILRYISGITEQQCLLRPFQSSKKQNIMRARNAWFVKIKRCVLRRPNRSGTKLFDAASRQPPHIFQLLEFWQSTAFLLWTLRNKHLLPSPHMEQHLYVPPWCLHCPDEGLARMHTCRLAPCPTDIWFFGGDFSTPMTCCLSWLLDDRIFPSLGAVVFFLF